MYHTKLFYAKVTVVYFYCLFSASEITSFFQLKSISYPKKKFPSLQGLVNNLISIGLGREAAFSAAVLGDNALMEKAWQDTGMLAEAVLHAHV